MVIIILLFIILLFIICVILGYSTDYWYNKYNEKPMIGEYISYPESHNLNDMIEFKVTERGMQILADNEKYGKNGIGGLKYFGIKEDGTGKCLLWEFMEVFGMYLFCGADPVTENNKITFTTGISDYRLQGRSKK